MKVPTIKSLIIQFILAGLCFGCNPQEQNSAGVKSKVTQISALTSPSPNNACQPLLNAKDKSEIDSSDVFSTCYYSMPEGSVLELPPGTYYLKKSLRVKKRGLTIKTLGHATGSRCNDNVHCARLKAAPGFNNAINSFIVVDYNDASDLPFIWQGLIFDGNKELFKISSTGFTGIGIAADDVQIMDSLIINFPKATALAVNQRWHNNLPNKLKNFKLINNKIAENGTHALDTLGNGMWADGVTIQDGESFIIQGNNFYNNTDVDFILGGCKNCLISGNSIGHSTDYKTSSFAAMMLHSWPNPDNVNIPVTSGDFTGTTIANNSIDCSPNRRCGYGILIGTGGWRSIPTLYPNNYSAAFGGSLQNNQIRHAMVGLSVDSLSGAMMFTNNNVYMSGGSFLATCNGSAPIDFSAKHISQSSIRHYNNGNVDPLWQVSENISCIPNPVGRDNLNLTSNLAKAKSKSQVEALYSILLQRPSDKQGSDYWTNQIVSGKMTLQNVLSYFIESNELSEKSNSEFVTRLYRNVLKRAPDSGGFTFWVGELDSGKRTRRQVAEAFFYSPEFKNNWSLLVFDQYL